VAAELVDELGLDFVLPWMPGRVARMARRWAPPEMSAARRMVAISLASLIRRISSIRLRTSRICAGATQPVRAWARTRLRASVTRLSQAGS
jgi:hypothetical protein